MSCGLPAGYQLAHQMPPAREEDVIERIAELTDGHRAA